MKRLNDALAGLLVGFFLGLMLFCLFAQPAHAGGYPPRSEPIQAPVIALVHEQRGCPRGQWRAYFFQDAFEPVAFCWRRCGDVVEVLDRANLITTMPASRFAPVSQGVSQ